MTDWRPTAGIARLQQRGRMLDAARQFFRKRDVLEVETPVLGALPVSDPHIESLQLATTGEWLRTSPEYHMKRLLAAGAPDIYQIGKVFRAGERGRHHEPEFTMAEWYRHGFDLEMMIRETCAFIQYAGAAAGLPQGTVEVHDYRQLGLEVTGVDLVTAETARLREMALSLPGTSAALVDDIDENATRTNRGRCLDLIMSHLVYPALPGDGLQVIRNYPAEQAMLARLDPDDPSVAQRFEVFAGGIELANGYRELRDPTEQAARFAADNARRRAAGLPEVAPDTALLAALEAGLPDCSGVAVGLDRLLLVAVSADRLSDVLSFPPGA